MPKSKTNQRNRSKGRRARSSESGQRRKSGSQPSRQRSRGEAAKENMGFDIEQGETTSEAGQ